MKKILLLSVLMIVSTAAARAEFKVEFKISEMHGFFDFLETIADKPHHSEVVLKVFKDSSYNTPANDQLIAELKTAQESMPGFDFNGFPKSRMRVLIWNFFSISRAFIRKIWPNSAIELWE